MHGRAPAPVGKRTVRTWAERASSECGPDGQTQRMTTTQLDLELASLRARRRSPSFMARMRSLPFLDRRAIKDPDSRDVYWVNVQRRLAESDYESLIRHRSSERPTATIG